MVQAAVADPTGVEGQLIEGPYPEGTLSRICEGDLAAGRLVEWGTDPEQQIAEMAALPAADVDAIMTNAQFTSTAGAVQYIAAANLDGVIGRDRIAPCRTVTVTFDASADWDTPSGVCRVDIYGVDAFGAECWDTIQKPNGSGAGTYTTRKAFAAVRTIDREACNGAGGTGTVGVSNDYVELSLSDYPGLSIYRAGKEPNTALRNYADEEACDILTNGKMLCVPEHAVSAGDEVYVRILAAGNDLRGQLTGQDGADTPTTYARLAGARWLAAAAADGLAIVKVGKV